MLAVLSVLYKGVMDQWNERAFNGTLYCLVLLLCSWKLIYLPSSFLWTRGLQSPNPYYARHWQTQGDEAFMDGGIVVRQVINHTEPYTKGPFFKRACVFSGKKKLVCADVLRFRFVTPISTGFYPLCVSKHCCKFALWTCPTVPPAISPTPHGSKCKLLTFFTWKKQVLFSLLSCVVQGSRAPAPGDALPGARQPWWCLQGG